MAELSRENFERQVYSGDYKALDFLSKLAALVPRPRHNLVRYHGVLARGCHQYNSKMRKLIVPKSRKTVKRKEDSKTHKSVEEVASQDELIAPHIVPGVDQGLLRKPPMAELKLLYDPGVSPLTLGPVITPAALAIISSSYSSPNLQLVSARF